MQRGEKVPPFAPSGCFAVRSPLLPYGEWASFSRDLRLPTVAEGEIEAALDHDRALLRARLRDLLERPEVREALFIASPSLDESLGIWLAAPDSERGRKVERTLVRYFGRMATRPTPFGLFAGCSVGAVGGEPSTRIVLGPRAGYRKHTRIDMDYLFALAEAQGRDEGLRRQLRYRPNSSLYRAAGRLRYAEARLRRQVRTYHLVAVEPTPYLEAALERAQAGATVDQIAALLVDEAAGITHDDAVGFVGELIDSQLLESALPPAVTGDEPIHGQIALLAAAGAAPLAARLTSARDELAALDAAPPGSPPERYRAIAQGLAELPPPLELARLFQVDLVKPATVATLGPRPIEALTRAVAALHRLAPTPVDALARFREQFERRYESRRVPLVEALDEESGIGFGAGDNGDHSPLLETIHLPGRSESETFERRHGLLLDLVGRALEGGRREVQLDEPLRRALENPSPPPLPDAFAVFATLAASSVEAIDRGDFRIYWSGAMGPSGAEMLGRFCHGDPVLLEQVRAHLRGEEAHRPEALFAEVVHLPEGRIGNVLLRPLLRQHEIPFLGRSGAGGDRLIPPTDLLVSVEGQRVVLHSQRLGREVVPRLTTAHNFDLRGLGLYRFLCRLQRQGTAGGLGWSWGPLAALPFLPRVTMGQVVLARARWQLGKAELAPLGKLDGAPLWRAVQELRTRRALPAQIVVADGDNALPVDLDNLLCVETFAQLVKGREQVHLEEATPSAEELIVEGPEGRFTHELLVPFLRRREEPAASPPSSAPVPIADPERRSIPGSDWLYGRLYLGTAAADLALREAIAPLVAELRRRGAIDRWFFLRYGDPDWHLRLRFHGEPRRLTGELLPLLHDALAPLLADGRAHRFEIGTYEREVERYGGPEGIRLSEALFEADSDAVLAIVETLAGDEGADARWRLALRGLDLLAGDFGLDLPARLALLRGLRDGFAREHRVDGGVEKQLGERFRKERLALEALLDPAQEQGSPLEPGLAALHRRSAQSAAPIAALHAAAAANRLTLPIDQLLASHLHMHANRLLRADARAQELVLYDFLVRLYEGRLARRPPRQSPAKES